MLLRTLVFSKKKKSKFLYLEDLYINEFNKTSKVITSANFPCETKGSMVIADSSKGLNVFNLIFPKMEYLNKYVFYAPIFYKLSISISILIKQLKLFLKGIVQGFFLEYRMIGLGFKTKKAGIFTLRAVKFDIGFSHFIRMPLSNMIRLCRIKKRFLFFSPDYNTIKIVSKQIQNVRKHNPYKLRGLRLSGVTYRTKPGKKQTKR